VAVSLKYGAEALALAGIAYSLIKWVGRNLRSLISDAPREESALEAISAPLPLAAADVLVRQGLVTPEDLSGMTPRERDFLIASALPHATAKAERGGASRPTPVQTNAVAGRAGSRAAALTPARLHLITPSRPPLGVSVHCPGCGAPLDRDALQRFGEATCQRCKRLVSAHIQRGRLTVIIEETVDEAEHRRRLDGGH
jgi:endogenous inhibitor of DNA gyrase (YacG/DUF329 family)